MSQYIFGSLDLAGQKPTSRVKSFLLPSLLNLMILFTISSETYAQEPLYPTLQPGVVAPNVKGKNEKGKSCSLYKIKSRLTLIYFYEVHCHLCESMIPDLKKLYEAYHKIGLEIVAVPTESSKEDWKKYIEENQLTWKHIFPHHTAALKTDYLLTVSPTFYLLDKKHILLTNRMGRIEEIENALNIHIR